MNNTVIHSIAQETKSEYGSIVEVDCNRHFFVGNSIYIFNIQVFVCVGTQNDQHYFYIYGNKIDPDWSPFSRLKINLLGTVTQNLSTSFVNDQATIYETDFSFGFEYLYEQLLVGNISDNTFLDIDLNYDIEVLNGSGNVLNSNLPEDGRLVYSKNLPIINTTEISQDESSSTLQYFIVISFFIVIGSVFVYSYSTRTRRYAGHRS